MPIEWSPSETDRHQDHVIAHVLGANVLGYFVIDEAVHLLLDMGFIWTIFLDGQMSLLPQSVAVSELETDSFIKEELNRDLDLLLGNDRSGPQTSTINAAPVECLIGAVELFARAQRRRVLLRGEAASLVIETSLDTGAILVSALSEP